MHDELRELYQEVILDHGKNPRNFYKLEEFTNEALGNNPMCGDALVVYLNLDDNNSINDASFQGSGCAISTASASMMTEIVKGKTITQAQMMFKAFHAMCTGHDENPELLLDFDDDIMERLRMLSGVRAFPVRVKCATLAWHTMEAAVSGEQEISTEDSAM